MKDKLSSALGLGKATPSASAVPSSAAQLESANAADVAAGLDPSIAPLSPELAATAVPDLSAPIATSLIDTGADLGGAAAASAASDTITADTLGTAAATDAAAGDAVTGAIVDTGADLGGAAVATDVAGDAIGATVADAGAEIGIEEILAASTWVICTELKSRKLISESEYRRASIKTLNLPQATIDGYHLWAIPFTSLMRTHSWAISLILPVAAGRVRYLNGEWNLLGAATVYLIEPMCWTLGKLFGKYKKDWRTLYANS